jgi:acyl carrier protein phosphodiesterase
MNYLAHAFLSFSEPEIRTGNMISDFVKGKSKFNYPAGIQKGIQLHRSIDTFTDFHPATERAKSFFKSRYRLYSGAFADVVYDHFLARDADQYKDDGGLENFSIQVYNSLEQYLQWFPLRFHIMFPHMKAHNWLYNYRLREGIKKSFAGLVYRAAYLYESDIAFEIFNEHYNEFKNCYDEFFPDVKKLHERCFRRCAKSFKSEIKKHCKKRRKNRKGCQSCVCD